MKPPTTQPDPAAAEGSEEPTSSTSPRAGARVSISNLKKTFRRASGEAVRAVDDVSLEVRAGEMLVLLGPSGCGKTTLLRCLAGVEYPDSGRIRVDNTVVFAAGTDERFVSVPPERRRLNMIFQSYALWPHMTAFDNVAYPLRVRGGVPRAEIESRVMESLKLVGIGNLAKQHPSAMSGGQQQRVALARAIVGGDNLVLFDEPLSNVDAKVREELRLEIMEMHERLGFTGVYVTHDQHEAMMIASRLAVMEEGRVAQIGTPRSVYGEPQSRYVATFIGTTNEIPGKVLRREDDRLVLTTQLGELAARLPDNPDRFSKGDDVAVISRPESWRVIAARTAAESRAVNTWIGVASHIQFAGSYLDVSVDVAGTILHVWEQQITADLKEGDEVVVQISPADARVV